MAADDVAAALEDIGAAPGVMTHGDADHGRVTPDIVAGFVSDAAVVPPAPVTADGTLKGALLCPPETWWGNALALPVDCSPKRTLACSAETLARAGLGVKTAVPVLRDYFAPLIRPTRRDRGCRDRKGQYRYYQSRK